MDLNSQKIDTVKQESGDWVGDIPDWGDLRLRVRGINNSDYKRLQTKLLGSLPRGMRVRGTIPQKDQDRITSTLLLNTVLLDWENLSEDGTPIPYSKEAAKQFLCEPEYEEFRAAVVWAASIVAKKADSAVEDALGNSPNASAGP